MPKIITSRAEIENAEFKYIPSLASSFTTAPQPPAL
jgi:hypothetical protein